MRIPEDLPPEVQEAYRILTQNLRHESLESLSDDDIPDWVVELVAIIEEQTEQNVTAIKSSSLKTYAPSTPLKGRTLGDWSRRRLTGRLRPTDPPAMELIHRGYDLYTTGNPVVIETILRDLGHFATADGNRCFVGVAG